QVFEEVEKITFVQEGEVHPKGAAIEIDGCGLASHRGEQPLPFYPELEVQKVMPASDPLYGIGPFQPALLADDLQGFEAPVNVELCLDLALLLDDASEPFGV